MADDAKTEDLQYKKDEVVQGGDLEGGESFATYALEDNDTSDYYAAGKEYRTYANETDKPQWSDEEKKLLGLLPKDDDKDSEEKPKAPGSPSVDARVTNDPKIPAAPTAPSK